MVFSIVFWAGPCKCISISMTLQKRQWITSSASDWLVEKQWRKQLLLFGSSCEKGFPFFYWTNSHCLFPPNTVARGNKIKLSTVDDIVLSPISEENSWFALRVQSSPWSKSFKKENLMSDKKRTTFFRFSCWAKKSFFISTQPPPLKSMYAYIHEPLKQRTYHSDDFVLAPIVGMMAH
jgi:hypothetical protein